MWPDSELVLLRYLTVCHIFDLVKTISVITTPRCNGNECAFFLSYSFIICKYWQSQQSVAQEMKIVPKKEMCSTKRIIREDNSVSNEVMYESCMLMTSWMIIYVM